MYVVCETVKRSGKAFIPLIISLSASTHNRHILIRYIIISITLLLLPWSGSPSELGIVSFAATSSVRGILALLYIKSQFLF